MSVLQVDDLSKHFGGLSVLESVSFTVEGGQKVALIGPNGAGKSTLLNVVAGEFLASSGRVLLDGKDVTRLPINERLHLGMGRSYQGNNLFVELSTMVNVLLALFGAEKSHVRLRSQLERREDLVAEAERLLETVGLWERRTELLSTLSYGEQRLVELVCGFASKPRIILLDEPSAGLPTAEAAAFANVVRLLAGNTSVLFCAHDLDLVFNLADSIMVLYFGRIIAFGSPKEISGNPQVQEIYLGSVRSS